MKKPIDPVKQFRDWMKNTLRRAFFRYWERTKALQAARVDRGVYKCAGCSALSSVKGMHIDHISPVVDPAVGFVGWDVYVDRLFCPASNLQLLCKPCHTVKTERERGERKAAKTGVYAPGRKATEETKAKMSVAQKVLAQTESRVEALKQTQEQRKKGVTATNVATGTTIEFGSATEAGEHCGVSVGNISTICNGGKRSQSKGWQFTYTETL